VSTILNQALEATESCECEEGCVQCVQSPRCKENNTVSSKLGALVVLKTILGLVIDWDTIIPTAIDDGRGGDFRFEDTIVEAQGVGVVEGVVVESDA
jgi:DEAD/DEAH box helicase domain-containing protein